MNKNNPYPPSYWGNVPSLQFTQLTPDDISKHKDSYACLLINDTSKTLSEKGQELHDAVQIFYRAFK